MAILKCKMCGGALAPAPNSTIAECEYCGSLQTLPRVNDERLSGLYERANDLRISHEFDKAVEVYEKIIEENPSDADAYWSMVLCKYGIDYVEEFKGAPRKPTINRAQLVPVKEDANYRSALKYADAEQSKIYEAEAARIDQILQRYLEISRKEPPYDVFICYKETDPNGGRTKDAVRAGEIYRDLTREGFKVFYAPVTLESKLGEDYEPYIFSAIQSAKVMLVIGTKPEYMNAVWVKNEWSRFLTLAKTDSKKHLIPVYDDMDPYEMPEAFRLTQSQDMGKLGFMLDLLRGIEKLVGKNTPEKTTQSTPRTTTPPPSANVDVLLQRVGIFLEDQDWSSANIYCEKVLDIAPTNGKAYYYKLLAEARVPNENGLRAYHVALDTLKMYKNAVRYADETTSANLIAYNQEVKKRLAEERERARIAEEYRQKGNSLVRARNNAASLVASQVQEKERLESLLTDNQYALSNQKKYKRGIIVPAIITIICALIVFQSLVENTEIGPLFWFIEIIPAMMLAHARGRSKIKALLQVLFTVGLFPFFSALKGLGEAFGVSVKSTQKEQETIRASIRQMEEQIDTSRKSLSELNAQIEAHEASGKGVQV